ncbi:hypothetical protein OROMI_026271 [Orobanche minor]
MKQNNELLLRNHESRPIGSIPVPEAHVVTSSTYGNGRGNNKGKGKHFHFKKNNVYRNSRFKPHHQEWKSGAPNNEQKPNKGKDLSEKPVKNKEDICYRCGMTGHWSRTCHTARHLVNLYQASMKRPATVIEINPIETMDTSTSSPHIYLDSLTNSEEDKWDISGYLNNPDTGEINVFPKRAKSPTLPSSSGVSLENIVFNSDGQKRSLIDYRDLDSPEAMPSPSLGFGSRSSGRESSRPFIGNQMPSPPNVRASQSKHYIDSASPPVQEDMSPALSMTGAYQSGRTHQNTNADVPLPKRTRSPTIPSTSGGVPQDPAIAFDGHKRASEFRSQSKSEVAGDMPMHSPALKRTKIPLRSSPQVFEENLDSSQEIVRELLAKEKRLARFKDEVSQPVQSLSTVRSQKVPVKIQHPSTSGRQKLSEDLTTAGIGDSAGGNFSSDYEEMLSSRIVGLCPDMCPESERAERERKGDLDQYERLDGDRNLTSEFLAVKKYTRTAEREADLIRPMPILQKTMDYLLSLLDEPYDDTFLGLYNFLWDRMRAIRMDLRMQHIFNRGAINMLEQMIRLHIIAMHELCEYTKGEGFSEGFDAHLNIEQMNKTSVELFQLYDDHRKRGIHVPSEREFRGYYALLKLDKHPGYKVEPAELSLDLAKMTPEVRQTPEVLFARDVASLQNGQFYSLL